MIFLEHMIEYNKHLVMYKKNIQGQVYSVDAAVIRDFTFKMMKDAAPWVSLKMKVGLNLALPHLA